MNGDYTLAANSQAINKGKDSYITDYSTDLAGNSRIAGISVDIGAFEYQRVSGLETPSTVVTTERDVVDYSDNKISLREAINYAGEGNVITFAPSLAGKTITLGGNELPISRGMTIDASSIGGITIDADAKSRVFYVSGSSVAFVSLTISGGSGSDNGGGIFHKSGVLTMNGCTVTGNNTRGGGGGIYKDGGTLNMVNCLVAGNFAAGAGGGIHQVWNGGTMTLTNCTVAGNTATESGGGVYTNGGTLNINNTIVLLNTSDSGGDMNCGGNRYAYNSLSTYDSWTDKWKYLLYDPALPLFTDAANDDYTLAKDSQAINVGKNSYIEELGCSTDLSGNPRIVDGKVDIGAYEYQGDSEISSVVVTTSLDVSDPTDHLISLREAIAYAQAGDTVTFDARLAGQTIVLGGEQIEISKSVKIDASDIGGVTIDADGKSRVFNVSGGSGDSPVQLINLTITGGYENGSGGGISNTGVLAMTDCTVSGNSADSDFSSDSDSDAAYSSAYSSGGGISNSGVLTMTNCTVSGNSANSNSSASSPDYADSSAGSSGGGIFNAKNSTLTMTNCTVSGNSADSNSSAFAYSDSSYPASSSASSSGGGIFNSGTLTMTDCTVSGTSADSDSDSSYNAYCDSSGGGISNTGTLTLMNCDVSGNSANSYARGSYNGFIIETTSTASSSGGGISNTGILTLMNSIVSGNIANSDSTAVFSFASSSGGGIYNGENSTLTMTDCTVSVNSADSHANAIITESSSSGGGIFNAKNSTLTMTNCTVSENFAGSYADSSDSTASSYGGGICNSFGTVTMTNCTVSGNSADFTYPITDGSSDSLGGGIYNSYGTLNLYNAIIAQNTASSSEDDVYRKSGSLYAYNTLSSFINWTSGSSNNLTYKSSQPLFKDAADGDYSLAKNSQAIDKGNNSYIDTDTDLAGNPRIVGGIVDLGAYEYQGGGGGGSQLAAPTISTGSRGVYASYGANRHQIQWSAVANASGYELAYSADGNSWTTVSASGTGAVVTGLTYGAAMQYRVRALGTGSYTDSDWSAVKVFSVCPMDINGDGDISGGDRSIVALMWLAEEGDDNFQNYADVNGDGEISVPDRQFIGSNWNKEAGDDDLTYPRPVRAADAVFAAYESGDIDTDLNIF